VKSSRVNGPLCTGMNGAPDEGDTHQLALMTSHFLGNKSAHPTHTHTHTYTYAITRLLAPALKTRRRQAGGELVGRVLCVTMWEEWGLTRAEVKERTMQRDKPRSIKTMKGLFLLSSTVAHFFMCAFVFTLSVRRLAGNAVCTSRTLVTIP